MKKKFKNRVLKDSWNLSASFEKWLLPRLKCLLEHNSGYPEHKESLENWHSEIKENIKILKFLVKSESSHKSNKSKAINKIWNDGEFIEFLGETYEKIKFSATQSKYDIQLKEDFICDFYRKKLMKWIAENFSDLWW